MRSLHGMDSAQAAIAEGRLGWAMAKCGRTEEGIRLLRSAVEGVTAELGADAPGAIYNQGLLGSALALAGQMAAAAATLDDAVARAARVLGTNDAVTRHFRAEREAIAAGAEGGAP
jgi:phosphoketolase